MKPLLLLGVIAWFSASVLGVVYLTRFENTPASQDVAYPQTFPTESGLARDPSLPTLIFFAHPKCPCTRASLRELDRLMAVVGGKVKTYVVFIKPKDESDNWANTDLRSMAGSIPNVDVIIDRDESETRVFNAQTSSLTLLYDRTGNLRFDGGITAARGHEGDNAGRTAIVDIVTSEAEMSGRSFVFGCPLHQPHCPGEMIPTGDQ